MSIRAVGELKGCDSERERVVRRGAIRADLMATNVDTSLSSDEELGSLLSGSSRFIRGALWASER